MNNSFLKKAVYREKGLRRWDLNATTSLFYSTFDDSYDAFQLYKGWNYHKYDSTINITSVECSPITKEHIHRCLDGE